MLTLSESEREMTARDEAGAYYGQRARQAWGGRYAQRLNHLTLEVYGTVCHLCGHDGADSADHVTPRSLGGSDNIGNLRPAHHRRCPTCGIRCNTARGARPLPASRPPLTDGTAFVD